MNWIFEIYGDTYKALAVKRPSPVSSQGGTTCKRASLPSFHPLAFLFRR